ncbi:MAG: sialate O-acetylesterase [Kiritimatiellaeota bacterium]|nr:sialate O-acetylesterase [Kiritimatiellota bacterium]
MKHTMRGLSLVLACLGVSLSAVADVRLPKVFSDHAVLQRDVKLIVWGWADPGERVTVKISKRSGQVAADQDGKWKVVLSPLKAGGPFELVVAGKTTNTVKDVLIGDVWICSGQSNMEFGLGGADNAQAAIQAATNTTIRLLHITAGQLAAPATDIPNVWTVCSPQTISGFSAVGYFFGKAIQGATGVPIGLIESAWGGTAIELWMPPAAWQQNAELAKRPVPGDLSRIYNGRIAPLAPYGVKGAIWYQGEANGGDDDIYFHKMSALINGWRQTWGELSEKRARAGVVPQHDLSFYFVQLANFQGPNQNPEGGDGWAKIRMAQFKSLQIPKTGMAVAIDVGAANDIHPRNKEDVGTRLARWALGNDYDQSRIVCSGPLYKGLKVEGDKLRLAFDYVGQGLMVGRQAGHGPAVEVKDGKLQRFAICGADRKWAWADAVIAGKTVLVSSTNVVQPVAVRYAYSMNPEGCNLYNKDGLPASPFRTDNW